MSIWRPPCPLGGLGVGNLARAILSGLGLLYILIQWLGDQAWRPLRGVVGRLCSLAEPAMVSLALDGAHLPTEGEVVGGFRVSGLGFRV